MELSIISNSPIILTWSSNETILTLNNLAEGGGRDGETVKNVTLEFCRIQ